MLTSWCVVCTEQHLRQSHSVCIFIALPEMLRSLDNGHDFIGPSRRSSAPRTSFLRSKLRWTALIVNLFYYHLCSGFFQRASHSFAKALLRCSSSQVKLMTFMRSAHPNGLRMWTGISRTLRVADWPNECITLWVLTETHCLLKGLEFCHVMSCHVTKLAHGLLMSQWSCMEYGPYAHHPLRWQA